MNALYQNLLNQNINNVKIIAIGKEQYSADNSNWTDDNTLPVVNDPLPNDTWTNWDASQWDLFFLDTNGNYVEDLNINTWDDDAIYNTILGLLPSGCTDPAASNYNPDANIDDGSCIILAIESIEVPENYSLEQSYPNPFNPITTISFSIPEFSLATITAYNIKGEKLETLTNELLRIGNYSINWNASSYPSGVYLIRMESGEFSETQKVFLIK